MTLKYMYLNILLFWETALLPLLCFGIAIQQKIKAKHHKKLTTEVKPQESLSQIQFAQLGIVNKTKLIKKKTKKPTEFL